MGVTDWRIRAHRRDDWKMVVKEAKVLQGLQSHGVVVVHRYKQIEQVSGIVLYLEAAANKQLPYYNYTNRNLIDKSIQCRIQNKEKFLIVYHHGYENFYSAEN